MEKKSINVIWSEIALNDLYEIYLFLALKSTQAANKIIDNIYNKSLQLSLYGFAKSGQTDDINPKYRRLIEGNYKILIQ